MWPKRKISSFGSQIRATTNPELYGTSWEEQAFAEDASGARGGCVWPPRSYSCTFCRREFRSAQALGGHMNVHRRDRARLKQSQSTNNVGDHLTNIVYNHNTSLSTSSKVCTFVYNPNSDLDGGGFLESPSSPSRVLVQPASQINSDGKVFFPLFSSNPSMIQENRNYDTFDFKKDDKEYSKILDVSVSLKLFVCQSDEKEEGNSCKRQRTDSAKSSFFMKKNSKAIDIGSSISIEGLDLELRLGENPKVK
jgi:hypothetical protein